jgi:glyoxylase-like metal-dependent hydrolase (beta-lactamase superfamily II)
LIFGRRAADNLPLPNPETADQSALTPRCKLIYDTTMKSSGIILVALLSALPGYSFGEFDYPMQAERIADNVYAILTPTRELPNPENGGWNSNSAFVITGEGVVLFDSGSSTEIGRAINKTISGVTQQPVRWIVNSHAHGDHWLGNAAFEDSVEGIYASPEVIDAIDGGGQGWVHSFSRMTGGITGDSEIRLPDQVVEQRTQLSLGATELVLLPGANSHSPGDLMLWLPAQKVLISGDVVYSDRMPSTNAGNLQSWIALLQELQELQPEVVVPGHGTVTDVSGIRRLQALLLAIWEAVEEGVDGGVSDYEMLPPGERRAKLVQSRVAGTRRKTETRYFTCFPAGRSRCIRVAGALMIRGFRA